MSDKGKTVRGKVVGWVAIDFVGVIEGPCSRYQAEAVAKAVQAVRKDRIRVAAVVIPNRKGGAK